MFEKLMPLLWYGLTNKSIAFLGEIEKAFIKDKSAMERLITYLKRNRPYIRKHDMDK
jgi:hypothetical protein